ncbi:hypothetical protein KEM54_000517 [Ascosphaera aggregata]|nr:hypothetical protein KEM54_000517 [Ascosphaera aggregata]
MSPPSVEVVAHVRAPSGAHDDARYRLQAQACLNFEPVSAFCNLGSCTNASQSDVFNSASRRGSVAPGCLIPEPVPSFKFEDTTDVFRSYISENGEEDLGWKPSALIADDDLHSRPAEKINSDNHANVTDEASETVQSSTDGVGSDAGYYSARLGDWIPLEESTASTESTKFSQLCEGVRTLVKRTPSMPNKDFTSQRGTDEDSDTSFEAPPSVVPDSQDSVFPTEGHSPLDNPALLSRRSRWRQTTSFEIIGLSRSSSILARTSQLGDSLPSAPQEPWTGDVDISRTPGKRLFQRVGLLSQASTANSVPHVASSRHDSQVTVDCNISAAADMPGSWRVETDPSPAEAMVKALPLKRLSFTSQQDFPQPQSKRRRLSCLVPPILPDKTSCGRTRAESDKEILPKSIQLSSEPVTRDCGDSFPELISSLPLEILPPGPQVLSAKKFKTHVTRALDMLVQHVVLNRVFKPAKKVRELSKTERGHWCVTICISDSPQRPDAECHLPTRMDMDSQGKQHQHLSPLGPNCWTFDRFKEFWDYLSRFISSGRASWGTWCTCELGDAERTTVSLDSRWHKLSGNELKTVKVQIKIYTWGELVPYIWVLLYVASDRQVRKVEGVTFKDGSGTKIITMD